MSMQTHTPPRTLMSVRQAALGAKLVALAGIGLVGYGIMFLIRNFTGFIELGLTPAHFVYGIATLGHLGLIYLDALILLVGTVLAYRGLQQ